MKPETTAAIEGMPFRRDDVVFFDAVGTVLAVTPSVAELYRAAGLEQGLELAIEVVDERFQSILKAEQSELETDAETERARWRRIVRAVLRELNDSASEVAFERLWNRFADPSHWRVYPAVDRLWRHLRTQGVKPGIASNFDERLVDICQRHPPLDTADYLFHSAELGIRKPSADFYRAIAARIGLDADRLHMVGDSPDGDVNAALTAGWTASWLPNGIC